MPYHLNYLSARKTLCRVFKLSKKKKEKDCTYTIKKLQNDK